MNCYQRSLNNAVKHIRKSYLEKGEEIESFRRLRKIFRPQTWWYPIERSYIKNKSK